MQPLTLACAARPSRPRGRATLLIVALAAIYTSPAAAEGACPWIVQPAEAGARASEHAYEIMFDGLDLNVATFYGFSVTSMDLAWQLAAKRSLPELKADARRLESVETTLGTFFQLAPDSIEPHTIYLVASEARVDELEEIGARIEPSRQLAISQLAMRTRGGSDQSGPLPHRSVPGVLIADAGSAGAPEVQICAYQVAMR